MTNEIATTKNNVDTTIAVSSIDNGPKVGDVVTSVDMSSNDGKMAVYNALQSDDTIDEHLGEHFALKDYVSKYVEVANSQTGEISQAWRTTLIMNDGQMISATSAGIMSSLNTLFSIFGQPQTWDKPLEIVINERKSRNGRRFYRIELA